MFFFFSKNPTEKKIGVGYPGLSDFFYYESKFKLKRKKFGGCGVGVEGGGWCECFFFY